MSDKLKVAHLSSAHPDRDTRIFVKQCASLAKAGHEVHMVLAGVEERTEFDVRVHSVVKSEGGRMSRAWKTVNAVYQKALEIDADVYHLHDPELLRIGKKLVKKGKKVVYDAHEDLPRQVLAKPYLKGRKIISAISEKWENRHAKKMSGVVTATPFIRDRFLKVNPNTIDINNFPIIDELYTDADTPHEQAICYVGGITKVRGISEMLDAMDTTSEKFILAGNFASDALLEECKAKSAWEQVDFRGFVSRDEVKEIYRQSDIGLVTLHPIINYLDALPVKMFEYMAAGVVVIASDFPYWKSIVEKENCGVCVDPLNPEAIRQAIQDLRNNPERMIELRKNGQEAVQRTYNWSVEEKKLLDWYQALVKK